MKTAWITLACAMLFSAALSAAGANFQPYWKRGGSGVKQKTAASYEYDVSIGVFYAMPLSPVGSNSFSVSYNESAAPAVAVEYNLGPDLSAGGEAGYFAFFHKMLPGNIRFVPLLFTIRYEPLQFNEGNSFFVKAGAGFSANRLTSSTFNPEWLNGAFLAKAGVALKIDKDLYIDVAVSDHVIMPKDPGQDLLQFLSLGTAVRMRF